MKRPYLDQYDRENYYLGTTNGQLSFFQFRVQQLIKEIKKCLK